MQASSLERDEGCRPPGRLASTEIIEGRMADAVIGWLDGNGVRPGSTMPPAAGSPTARHTRPANSPDEPNGDENDADRQRITTNRASKPICRAF